MKRASQTPRVALVVGTTSESGRQILAGFRRYLETNGRWQIRLIEPEGVGVLHEWEGDGVISQSMEGVVGDVVKKLRIPAVNLSEVEKIRGVSRVEYDYLGMGREAAEHLIGRGFERLAFVGPTESDEAEDYYRGFCMAVEIRRAGARPIWHKIAGIENGVLEAEREGMGEWLRQLDRSTGVATFTDGVGRLLLDVAACEGIDVPEEVAVVGTGDDALICQLCTPTLSSVSIDRERKGFEAGMLLSRLMKGECRGSKVERLEPLGVLERESTSVTADCGDEVVTAAVKIIQREACDGVTVSEILDELCVSRSLLERRFAKYRGHSPQAEIRQVRTKHMKHLLATTDLPLSEVASQSGYVHQEYMSVVFKREVGETPGAYRRQHRRLA